MAENLFLWNSEQTFGAGATENVARQDNGLVLAQAAGRYVQAGCYTTQEISCASFNALVAGWNTDTPAGTAVEVQARVQARGEWSPWLSFGKWSPFIRRRSAEAVHLPENGVALDENGISVGCPGGASAFQLRVFLYSDDVRCTPRVRMLSAGVRYAAWQREEGEPIHRCVPAPAYSQLIRDPRLSRRIGGPATLAVLLNRYGEDVLPEEIAHAVYDYATDSYANRSFLAAVAGCYGFDCCVRYLDIAGLKKEIKRGFACGAALCADPLAVPEDGAPDGCAQPHFVAVRGFETDVQGVQYVLYHDPAAESDDGAARSCTLAQFAAVWDGVALLLHGRADGRTLCPPQRRCAEVRAGEVPGEYSLYVQGERTSLPLDFLERGGICVGTIGYTVHDETRCYATTAHKRFFYTGVSETGNLALDTERMPAGTKLTVFAIGELGKMIVGELKL